MKQMKGFSLAVSCVTARLIMTSAGLLVAPSAMTPAECESWGVNEFAMQAEMSEGCKRESYEVSEEVQCKKHVSQRTNTLIHMLRIWQLAWNQRRGGMACRERAAAARPKPCSTYSTGKINSTDLILSGFDECC